jgi:prepilin-type N-terminal cleavage/methylation domain-containing protein
MFVLKEPHRRAGVTLTELLCVLAIMSILVSLYGPSASNRRSLGEGVVL